MKLKCRKHKRNNGRAEQNLWVGEEKKPKRRQSRKWSVKKEKRYENKTLNLLKQKQKLTKELFEDDDDGLEGKEIREKEHKKHDIIISSSSIFVFIWFHRSNSIRLYVTKFLGSEKLKKITLFFKNNTIWSYSYSHRYILS